MKDGKKPRVKATEVTLFGWDRGLAHVEGRHAVTR